MKREPLSLIMCLVVIIQAAVHLLDMEIDTDLAEAIATAVLILGGTVWARSKVTPVAAPRL